MIFYFSGTGNSFAAATQLQYRLGGKLINITDCLHKKFYSFDIEDGEAVGIVCPVYFDGLPSIVNFFIDRMKFNITPSYLYGVFTYGGMAFGVTESFAKRVQRRGYEVSASWGVKMPANYAMLYEPTKEEKAEIVLEKADERLDVIISNIKERRHTGSNPLRKLVSGIIYPKYNKARKTAGFYTDETCIGCGVCAGRCPVRAIKMIDGKPVWVKDTCVFCMSCVRCNAIQYETKLQGRYRYRHPIYQKKKKAASENCH